MFCVAVYGGTESTTCYASLRSTSSHGGRTLDNAFCLIQMLFSFISMALRLLFLPTALYFPNAHLFSNSNIGQ